MRRLIVPVLAMLLCAPGAHAKGIGCLVLRDADRDVHGPVVVPDPANAHVQEELAHLDLYWGTIEAVGRDLVVRFYVRGYKHVADGRRGTWTMTFTTRGARAVVTATSDGRSTSGAPLLTYRAGLDGRELVPVTGAFGNVYIKVTVPLAALGDVAPRPRDVLRDFRMESYETLVAGTGVTVRDTAEGQRAGTYVPAGGRFCP